MIQYKALSHQNVNVFITFMPQTYRLSEAFTQTNLLLGKFFVPDPAEVGFMSFLLKVESSDNVKKRK